jgi:catechol 2,3-dioxygenase-like lactoylglutathione lyase family enzyme
MTVYGINHVDFYTDDPDRLRRFYSELLGAEALDGFHDPLRAGPTQLAFQKPEHAGAAGTELAFDTNAAGYDEMLERARRTGLLTDDEPVTWNASARSFWVRDPDGRRIEICHHDHGVFWRT